MLPDSPTIIKDISKVMNPILVEAYHCGDDYINALESDFQEAKKDIKSQWSSLQSYRKTAFNIYSGINVLMGAAAIYFLSNGFDTNMILDGSLQANAFIFLSGLILLLDLLLLVLLFSAFGTQDARMPSFVALVPDVAQKGVVSSKKHQLQVLKNKWTVLHKTYYVQQHQEEKISLSLDLLMVLTVLIALFSGFGQAFTIMHKSAAKEASMAKQPTNESEDMKKDEEEKVDPVFKESPDTGVELPASLPPLSPPDPSKTVDIETQVDLLRKSYELQQKEQRKKTKEEINIQTDRTQAQRVETTKSEEKN